MTSTAITTETAAAPASGAAGTAVVFPGQGSQRPGMAERWQGHPAFERWAEADEVLGWDVSRLGLSAGADELREPLHCQVALFVHHAVLLEAWRASGGGAGVAAGHSLGEYSALLAAGVVTFAGGLRLVEQRARATQAAAEAAPGSMVACLGGTFDEVRAAAEDAGASVANDNAAGQVVVAGDAAALERLAAAATSWRVVPLAVGAAYHSPFMAPAVERFSPALAAAHFDDARIPVIANVDAQPHTKASDWPLVLSRQLTAPVRWRESMLALAGMASGGVVELAAAPVLTGLAKRTVPELDRRCIATPDDLEQR